MYQVLAKIYVRFFYYGITLIQVKTIKKYRKIPKISPGTYFFSKALFEGLTFGGAYFRRDICSKRLIYGGKCAFQSLIVGRKFTVFGLFYFAFKGNFRVQAPGGAYVWRGDLRKVFLALPVWGLIFGGAYFLNFTVTCWDVVKCNEHSVKTFIVLF